MCHVIAVVREEVACIDRPIEFSLLLLLLDSLHVVINSAVEEVELPTIRMIHEDSSRIIKELIVNMSKLPSKVHTSCYHDLISLIVRSVRVEAP